MANQIQDVPQAIQERLSRTPAERKAELEAKRQARLAAMTAEQRQALQARTDRINAVPVKKRPAFAQASRLTAVARSLKVRVEASMKFANLLEMPHAGEAEAGTDPAQQLFRYSRLRTLVQQRSDPP